MANLRVNLNIASTDVLSSALNLSLEKVMSVDSGNLIRAKVKGTAADSNDLAVYVANQCSDRAYLYIKNLSGTSTDYVWIYDDSTSGDPRLLKLAGGDWAWMPLVGDYTVRAYATTNPTNIEFGVFGVDQ